MTLCHILPEWRGWVNMITVTLCVLLGNSEWILGTYKLNVLTWLGLLLLCMILHQCSYSSLFFFIYRRWFPKLLRAVAAITILYRNTKVKVRSPGGDTDYLDIIAGVLQGDTLAPYLLIICRDYMLRTSIDKIKDNGLEQTKEWNRRYTAKTITDYADDSDSGKYTRLSRNTTA